MKLTMNFWRRASSARNNLAEQLKDNANVSFVDIGYPQNNDRRNKKISLRINARKNVTSAERQSFPKSVDGIPVVVSKPSKRSWWRRK